MASLNSFNCDFPGCFKSFKRKDYLSRHELNHSQIKPFNCDICKLSFSRKDLLEKHKRSKTHLISSNHTDTIFVNTFATPAKRSKRTITSTATPPTPATISNLGKYLSNDDKFSNVANSIEDSFGWLFGNESPIDSLTNLTVLEDFYNSNVGNDSIIDQDLMVDNVLSVTIVEELKVFLQINLSLDFKTVCSFNVTNFNYYLSQYWANFDCIYPIIHRPSFQTTSLNNDIQTLLLLSMICIGMTYEFKSDLTIAEKLLQRIRLKLFEELDSSSATLQLLQTLLLNDVFFLSTKHTYTYHPVLLNILREMNLFENLVEPIMTSFDLEQWEEWIQYESLKRVVFVAYIMDTQASFFYGCNPMISIFDVQLELPYADSVWTANTLQIFQNQYEKLPRGFLARNGEIPMESSTRYVIDGEDIISKGNLIPNVKSEGKWPNFLFSLKRLMQPYSKEHQEYHVDCFSQFSRYIFLHGVISLVKDLRNCNVLDIKDRFNSMAAKIEQSFLSWKSYFHHNISEINNKRDDDGLVNVYDLSPLFWSNLSMLNVGLLGLYCNFDLVLQYVSNTTRLDNSLKCSPGRLKFETIETSRNEYLMKSWARSRDGEYALKQACLILRMSLMINDRALIDKIPHLPYCIYISTIICWVYSQNKVDRVDEEIPRRYSYHEDIETDVFRFISKVLKSEDDESDDESDEALDDVYDDSLMQSLVVFVIKILDKWDDLKGSLQVLIT